MHAWTTLCKFAATISNNKQQSSEKHTHTHPQMAISTLGKENAELATLAL